MKCSNCGFDTPINEWVAIEESGLMRLPKETIKEYEGFVDQQNTSQELKGFVKFTFRLLAELGFMPYHKTVYSCPKCGAKA